MTRKTIITKTIMATFAALSLTACAVSNPTPPMQPVAIGLQEPEQQASCTAPLGQRYGVRYVNAIFNGTHYSSFLINSGAADTTITPRFFEKLVANGTIDNSDLGPMQFYRTADGAEPNVPPALD